MYFRRTKHKNVINEITQYGRHYLDCCISLCPVLPWFACQCDDVCTVAFGSSSISTNRFVSKFTPINQNTQQSAAKSFLNYLLCHAFFFTFYLLQLQHKTDEISFKKSTVYIKLSLNDCHVNLRIIVHKL